MATRKKEETEVVETADEPTTYDAASDYAKRLAAVNASMIFTDIRGKQYAEVNQRILGFWALFPEGRIVTRKVSDDGSRCDFEAAIYRHRDDERAAVTGHAFEVKKGNVNSTSYVENCETSAIGRALGFLGIGATSAIASADEVLQAIAQQPAEQGPQFQPVDSAWVEEQASRMGALGMADLDAYRTYLTWEWENEGPDAARAHADETAAQWGEGVERQ